MRKTDESAGAPVDAGLGTASIKVDTLYRASGGSRYTLESNPYRAATSGAAGSEATMGWTRTKVDANGNSEVETFSGADQPEPWGSNGTSTGKVTTVRNVEKQQVTDQTGKVRETKLDVLGRVAEVVEDATGTSPYSTTYGYDALDNLATVTQGTQTRTFANSSLGRLVSATNPESGTQSYTYDGVGNLTTRVDARNITTSIDYDALNRPIRKSYSDGTATVIWCYDGDVANHTLPEVVRDCQEAPASTAGNLKGRVTMVANAASKTKYAAYDALGRVVAQTQATGAGPAYGFSYEYWPAGLMSVIYPSGRKVKTSLDGAGRSAKLEDWTGGTLQKSFVSGVKYAALGAASELTLGPAVGTTTLTESRTFNPRLQPETLELKNGATSLAKLKLAYAWTVGCNGSLASCNNGNVASQTITRGSFALTQGYTYDSLNRLKTAQESGASLWSQTYVYDRYGNRALLTGSYVPAGPLTPVVTADSAAQVEALYDGNRLKAATADAGGNVMSPGVSGYSLVYDGENRLVSATTPAGGVTTFGYDGDGRRVTKTAGGVTATLVYDAEGQLAAEYTSGAVTETGLRWLFADHLGSTRAVVDGSGSEVARYDYLPFGEDLASGVNGRGSLHPAGTAMVSGVGYTGQYRDGETGLDYFGARYFSAALGKPITVLLPNRSPFSHSDHLWPEQPKSDRFPRRALIAFAGER